MKQEFKVVEARTREEKTPDGLREERIGRLVALGQALSDPIRVQMLGMMAEGRSCCELPDRGAPTVGGEDPGICVCEFEDYFEMGQSRISYHMKKLKNAGLVREEKRGKWSFYSIDSRAVDELLGEAADHLSAQPVGNVLPTFNSTRAENA